MMMIRATAVAAVLSALSHVGGAASPQQSFYIFNNSIIVPGTSSLLQFDAASKKYEVAAEDHAHPGFDCVSGSVVCGDTYYAAWANFPINSGILAAPVGNKDATIKYNPAPAGINYHALACSRNGSLYTLKSVAASSGASFVLSEYDFASGADNQIGAFPDVNYNGFDAPFKFSADGKYLYAQFSNNKDVTKANTGSLYIMDTSDGSIQGPLAYPTSPAPGLPYHIFPGSSPDASFSSAFLNTENPDNVKLCDVQRDGSKLTTSNCVSAPYLQTSSAPAPVCQDGAAYALPPNIGEGPGTSQQLVRVDLNAKTGTPIVDLSSVIPGNYLGTITCA